MLFLAVYANLIPFDYRPRPLDDAIAAFRHITFHDPWDLGARGDWIVSVIVFSALSYLLMAALCVDRGVVAGLCVAPAVALFCALLSVVIEFVQLYFPPRTVSLNDIALETMGGVAGTLTWLIAGQRITRWLRRVAMATGLSGLACRLLPGYIALLLVIQLMPFDLTVSPAELALKYQENKVRLVPFGHYSTDPKVALLLKIAANMTCFFPLGFLKVLASESGGRGRTRWVAVFLFGLASAALVEFLQLFVYSRVFDATDIVTGTAGVLVGWSAGELFLSAWRSAVAGPNGSDMVGSGLSQRRTLLAVLVLAWFGAILYLNWSPFNFTTEPSRFTNEPEELEVWGLRRMSWLPLVDYYWGSKYQAIEQFLKKAVSFLPLGILCGMALPRLYLRGATLGVVFIAILAALTIEVGRYFLPSHRPSVTDVFFQCFGAWLGFKLTQHVRALLWAESTLYGYFRQAALGQFWPASRSV